MTRVLVLGGNGFIGRHAVDALSGLSDVVTGTRRPSAQSYSQHRFRLEEMLAPADWKHVVREFDVILNCVGILRPQWKASYEDIHHFAPRAIAQACEEAETRFVHVSALGLGTTDRSRFLTSKRRGEDAVMLTRGDWIIARPSLLDGEGGYGASWLRGVAKLPAFAAPSDARGQIAALTVTDLGLALAKLCLESDVELDLSSSRCFDLGGAATYTFEGYIRGLRRRHTRDTALGIPIPGWSARLAAHLCDMFYLTPFSFGHWELLRKDNLPDPNRLPALLGRPAAAVIEPLQNPGECTEQG